MFLQPGESWACGAVVDATEALRFSSIELRAIGLGERVDVAREKPVLTGPARRLLGWLFGVTAAQPLANPQLEALRRFASKARHRRAELNRADVEALVAAGYTAGQAWGLTGYLAGRPRLGAQA